MNYYPNREIQLAPKEVDLLYLPTKPTHDPVANAIALFITEILHRLLRVEVGENDLFSFITKIVKSLDTLPTNHLASLHLQFLVELCHHLGILPVSETYKRGYVLSFDDGSFHPIARPQEAIFQEPSAHLIAFICSEMPCSIPLNKHQRNALLTLLLEYVSYHYPNLGAIRSPEILSSLFSSSDILLR